MIYLDLLSVAIFVYWLSMLAITPKGLASMPALPTTKYPLLHKPFVSVIIAAKEEESSIIDTVRHLLNQNYTRMELIVVNDRSPDRSEERRVGKAMR